MTALESKERWAPAEPTEVFDTFWRFAAERQRVFFKRAEGIEPPWTDDTILREYRFTNAYRAADRVSQYLIRNVIYSGRYSTEDTFFRVILFKLFNRIDTWELLQRAFGRISWDDYSFARYARILTEAMSSGQRIYSPAYMMPSGRRAFGSPRKHENHLRLIETMMADSAPNRIAMCERMQDAFILLKGYPSLGDFLAFQFVTDLNYSKMVDWSEMEFVVPGPGARDGIRKCFQTLGGLNEAELISLVTERQADEFSCRGIEFPTLWGRPLQLIDIQNLFCEVDKYARVAHPEVSGISGRTRIKQRHRPNGLGIQYSFPPKWKLESAIHAWMARAANRAMP